MKTNQMTLQVSDILSGEEPPETGYYLIIYDSVDGEEGFEPMYWVADKHAWASRKDADGLLMPTQYWGRYWTKNFMSEVER